MARKKSCLTFEQVAVKAAVYGLFLLEFVSARAAARFRCAKGHEFTRNIYSLAHECYDCRLERITKTKEQHLETRRERRKRPDVKDKEALLAIGYRQSETAKTTKLRYKQTDAYKISQNKYKQKPNVRIAIALRRRLGSAVKNGAKVGSAVRDLQCTIPEFNSYIEVFWYDAPNGTKMTWENWGKGPGKWQIDHIIPLCQFDLSKREEFLKAACFINMQPLWHEDHARKTAGERQFSF